MGCRDLHSGSVGNQKRHHDDKQRSNATSPFEWWSCCCSLDSQASLHLHSSFSAQTLWYANHANQASCFLGWWEIWPMFSSPYCPLTYHPQPLLFRRLWCVRFIIDLFTFISVTNRVISSTFPLPTLPPIIIPIFTNVTFSDLSSSFVWTIHDWRSSLPR